MESDITPCSGFVTVDDNGTPCAGFRQCGSTKGVPGGAGWDVPLEIRCATNEFLTDWSDPIWLYDMVSVCAGFFVLGPAVKYRETKREK